MKAKSIGITISSKLIANKLGLREDDVFDMTTEIDAILDREYRKLFPSHLFSLEETVVGDDTTLILYDVFDEPIELHEYAQLLSLNSEAFRNSIDQIESWFRNGRAV